MLGRQSVTCPLRMNCDRKGHSTKVRSQSPEVGYGALDLFRSWIPASAGQMSSVRCHFLPVQSRGCGPRHCVCRVGGFRKSVQDHPNRFTGRRGGSFSRSRSSAENISIPISPLSRNLSSLARTVNISLMFFFRPYRICDKV